MKPAFLILLTFLLFSCKKTEENFGKPAPETVTETKSDNLGQEIFDGKGMCYSCHKPDAKIIGPSIKEIANIYKKNNADIKLFLQEKSEPIVDPSQYSVMKTNFAITKTFTPEELIAVEKYMMIFAE
ncbi:cytochrome C552 [Flavobacterium sp. NST-5]|uniref:Cytochrome C552 n=1 Tax=Flavobacterium ichthyis TaxID=2698827 RepID=A0ABW9ZF82_9FLAO|nr:c-type cytochrome [Flavobacterium ichthyis]NBL65428.1 cytochrome C552 [Flavobacterium ichthyis]